MLCRKSLLKCDCWSTGTDTTKKRARTGDKRGQNTTRNGVEWCGRCTCRVVNGRCTNVQCSQNRK